MPCVWHHKHTRGCVTEWTRNDQTHFHTCILSQQRLEVMSRIWHHMWLWICLESLCGIYGGHLHFSCAEFVGSALRQYQIKYLSRSHCLKTTVFSYESKGNCYFKGDLKCESAKTQVIHWEANVFSMFLFSNAECRGVSLTAGLECCRSPAVTSLLNVGELGHYTRQAQARLYSHAGTAKSK